jgi:hypothetical protein
MEIFNYGFQHSIDRLLTSYLINLVIETERVVKLLDTKLQNSYRFMAANRLKQINSVNHYNPLQKDDYMP